MEGCITCGVRVKGIEYAGAYLTSVFERGGERERGSVCEMGGEEIGGEEMGEEEMGGERERLTGAPSFPGPPIGPLGPASPVSPSGPASPLSPFGPPGPCAHQEGKG